jgi:hypothetical protein
MEDNLTRGKLSAALLVFLLNPAVRPILDELDPKAVEQAKAALRAAGIADEMMDLDQKLVDDFATFQASCVATFIRGMNKRRDEDTSGHTR